jgi:hypothetical protein
MKRALVLVEGATEERFVKDLLRPHLWTLNLDIAPTLLVTKRVKRGGSFRGGVTGFGKFENDAKRLLASAGDALVTTMLDYYRLPADFPGMATRPLGTPIQRVGHVERAMQKHFGSPANFLTYLALHEFEALLFSSPEELPRAVTQPEKKSEFAAIRAEFPTPEDINERPGKSPSKRIERLFPAYRKAIHGPSTVARIGLERIRVECPHFAEWLNKLESYARAT